MRLNFVFLLLGVSLLMQCSSSSKVVDWDKKKAKWIASIPDSPESYQVIVDVPLSESSTENVIKAEEKARVALGNMVVEPLQGSLWNKLSLESRELEAMQRSRHLLIGESMADVKLRSSFASDQAFFGAYTLNKEAYKRERKTAKLEALKRAKATLEEGLVMKENNPQDAARLFCEALLTIEGYLGEELSVMGSDSQFQEVDLKIFEEMNALSKSLSFATDPKETIVLNKANDFIGTMNFEVQMNGKRTGPLNVAVDLAGIRQEKINAAEYDILVTDLPVNISKPWISLRSDLFANLRENGNVITQLIYKKLGSVEKKVTIKRVYPKLYIQSKNKGEWGSSLGAMLKKGLKELKVEVVDDKSLAEIVVVPSAPMTIDETPSHTKGNVQWTLLIEGAGDAVKGKKLLTTAKSKELAKQDLISQLESQLKSSLIEELLMRITQ